MHSNDYDPTEYPNEEARNAANEDAMITHMTVTMVIVFSVVIILFWALFR